MATPRAAFAALALLACNEGRLPMDRPAATSAASLARFADCADLRSYVARSWTETLVQSRYGYYGRGDMPLAEDAEAGGDAEDGGGDGGPSDWSETNTQEAGVDEPDLVKTDGEHLYVVHGDELSILRSWPAEDTAELSALTLPGHPRSLFLQGDRLVVFSSDWVEGEGGAWGEGAGAADERSYYTDLARMTVVDVSDRADPQVTREIAVEGWMADARMVDGQVYAVVNTWSWMPQELWELAWSDALPELDWDASEWRVAAARNQARAMLLPEVRRVVDALPDGALLPRATDGAPGAEADPRPVMGCAEVYGPEVLAAPNLMSVLHLDLSAEGEPGASPETNPLSGTGVMAGGWNVYASQEALYVAQTSWDWWWGEGEPEVSSHLHKFALEGDGATYLASGEVDGWILNQFSMSEHDGYLRVATTDFTPWAWSGDGEPASHVTVLDERQGRLDRVGHVGGIAPGETIQSARLLGDKGYVVTFEQIDPLFTLDLSEPTDPRVVGELELPGFSTYLHPYGDDHLVSVGFAGTWEGEITGMAVSLFDVSDFANPRLADQVLLEGDDWSWSEALYDHHAFTLHDGVLSLPVYTYSWDGVEEDWFSGMLVLEVDAGGGGGEAGFTELGRVDHGDLVRESVCAWDEGSGRPCAEDYWYASMRRSVVIEGQLYSISDYGVKVNAHRDPGAETARVLWRPLSE